MSQVWLFPVSGGVARSTAWLGVINPGVEAVRTLFAGGSEPSATAPRMLWQEEANDYEIHQRDVGDGAFSGILAGSRKNHGREPGVHVAGIAATGNYPIYADRGGFRVESLVILSDVATAGSTGGNNWTFQLRDRTGALDLFATAPDTNGAGSSPGEILQYTPWVADVDQNEAILAEAYLELQVTKNGAPTDISAARMILAIRGQLIGT